MIPELPSPYKERMNDAVVQIYDHAHVAFDIAREFEAKSLELKNDDLIITITTNDLTSQHCCG